MVEHAGLHGLRRCWYTPNEDGADVVLNDPVHFRPAYLGKLHLTKGIVEVHGCGNEQMMVGKGNPYFFDQGSEIEKNGSAIERTAVGREVWILFGLDRLRI